MPAKWTTDEQAEFLQSWHQKYMGFTEKKDYQRFWPKLYNAWFAKWPESAVQFPGVDDPRTMEQDSALGIAVEARKKQLHTWFRWRANGSRRNRIEQKKKTTFSQVLAPEVRRRRTRAELYSLQCYEGCFNFRLDAQKEAGNIKTRGEALVDSQRSSRALLDTGEEYVKNNIQVMPVCDSQEPSTEASDPATIQDAIDELPLALVHIAKLIKSRTRWAVSFFCAGPDPSRNWEISCLSCHPNETPQGHSFAYIHPIEDNMVLSAFRTFAELLFPPDLRKPTTTNSKPCEVNVENRPGAPEGDTPRTEEDGTTIYTSSGAEDEWDIDDSLANITEGDDTNGDGKNEWCNIDNNDEGEGSDFNILGEMSVDEDNEMVGNASRTSFNVGLAADHVPQTALDASSTGHGAQSFGLGVHYESMNGMGPDIPPSGPVLCQNPSFNFGSVDDQMGEMLGDASATSMLVAYNPLSGGYNQGLATTAGGFLGTSMNWDFAGHNPDQFDPPLISNKRSTGLYNLIVPEVHLPAPIIPEVRPPAPSSLDAVLATGQQHHNHTPMSLSGEQRPEPQLMQCSLPARPEEPTGGAQNTRRLPPLKSTAAIRSSSMAPKTTPATSPNSKNPGKRCAKPAEQTQFIAAGTSTAPTTDGTSNVAEPRTSKRLPAKSKRNELANAIGTNQTSFVDTARKEEGERRKRVGVSIEIGATKKSKIK